MSINKTLYMMSEMPVRKAILKMSLPVVMGMMVQVLYNLVDTFFIGKLGDANQLAAANITAPVFMILMAIATIVSTGTSSIISRSLGKKDAETADKALSTGVIICIVLAVVMMIIALPFVGKLVIAMGASPAVKPFAIDYAFILLLGAVPVMLSYAGGQLVRSEGATMPSVIGMLLGTVVNVILDPIFIFGFDMGIKGAAIATVIGNIVAMSYYIYFYISKKSLVKISPKLISFNKKYGVELSVLAYQQCLANC